MKILRPGWLVTMIPRGYHAQDFSWLGMLAMKVRDADNAVVEIAKLQLFCLDAMHPLGSHKARQFATRLGYTSRDAEAIRDKLLRAIQRTTTAEFGERDLYGQRYTLEVEMDGPKGDAVVRTTWITREGAHGPKLLSCFLVDA